ncbi:MAG: sigma-70 family RNA polymerase sigma factor [Acidobacteriia bacterium]|nr:sigma-70 family RNA polymerase sigma factor [Terriglobia bacterium]
MAPLATVADPVESPHLEDFDEVVRLYWPRVFRFALASLRDHDAAESVAQDCFLRAHNARQAFRGECSVSTWLMQIAVNLVRDYGRNRRIQFWKRTRTSAPDLDAVSRSIADRGVSPEGRAQVKEQVEAVWRATGRLSEKQRTVFLLRFVEDMDLLEIAAATGMKEGTVKTHLFRATETIRQRLGGIT